VTGARACHPCSSPQWLLDRARSPNGAPVWLSKARRRSRGVRKGDPVGGSATARVCIERTPFLVTHAGTSIDLVPIAAHIILNRAGCGFARCRAALSHAAPVASASHAVRFYDTHRTMALQVWSCRQGQAGSSRKNEICGIHLDPGHRSIAKSSRAVLEAPFGLCNPSTGLIRRKLALIHFRSGIAVNRLKEAGFDFKYSGPKSARVSRRHGNSSLSFQPARSTGCNFYSNRISGGCRATGGRGEPGKLGRCSHDVLVGISSWHGHNPSSGPA
jgi:hypothetical protein